MISPFAILDKTISDAADEITDDNTPELVS